MHSPDVIDHALALLGGRLDRGDGIIVTAPVRPVSLVAPGDRPARIREVFAAGQRAAIPIALDASGAIAQLIGLVFMRWRIGVARRRLSAAGATRVHAVAVVSGQGMLGLVYELGPLVQPYVEERVVLETQGDAPMTRRLKRVLGRIAGVAISAAYVIVVGDPV